MDTTPEGLIRIPSQPERGGIQGLAVVFVLVTFAIAIIGTTLVDVLNPLAQPKLAGSEKLAYERMQEEATWSDGSLARLIEYEYKIRSRVRSQAAKPYAEFMYRNLAEVNSKVLMGSNGWLFLTSRVKVNGGENQLGSRRSAAYMGALSRRLGSMGMRHVFVPLPRKGVIAEEFLPLGANLGRSHDEVFIRSSRMHGVETVDLLSAWGAASDSEIYRRTDTHWTMDGMRVTAQAVAAFLGMDVPKDQRRGTIRTEVAGGKRGSLYRWIQVQARPSDKPNFSDDKLSVEVDGETIQVHDPAATLALCGTSFCAQDEFGTMVSHFFGQALDSYDSPGQPSIVSILRMLETRSKTTLPEIVLHETPIHHPIAKGRRPNVWSLDKQAGLFFGRYMPRKLTPLQPIRRVMVKNVKVGTPIEAARSWRIAQIPAKTIAHSGGGVVEFAIDIELQEGQAELVVRGAQSRYWVPLQTGWNRVILPVVSANSGSEKTEVFLAPKSKSATFVFGIAKVVSVVDEESRTSGEIASLQELDGRWTQDVVFPAGTLVQKHSTLIMETRGGAGALQGLQLEVWDASGDTYQSHDLDELLLGGLILVDLGLHLGKELGRVQLSGSTSDGSPKGSPLEKAGLYHQ